MAAVNCDSTLRVIRKVLPPYTESPYISNRVSTTLYTSANFLPVCLFNEFRKAANMYFLVIAILQSIPEISPLTPITAVFPLVCVVSLSILKEAIEDRNREESDNVVNKRVVNTLRGDDVKRLLWEEVIVGDLVQVQEKEEFPADIILLSTEDSAGTCFIDTSNLDGESALKERNALQETFQFQSLADCAKEDIEIKCGGPDDNILQFAGTLKIGHVTRRLDANQFLPRGARLENTSSIFGLVIYTGHETKVMQNSKQGHFKTTRIDHTVNRIVLYVFLCQVMLCIVGAIIHSSWLVKYGHVYVGLDGSTTEYLGILTFLGYLVLLNTLIPISLVVSVQMIKIVMANYVRWDELMVGEKNEGALANTSSLMEELGQVQYLFSDKTGTLTQNVMAFVKCTVNGNLYSVLEKDSRRSVSFTPTETKFDSHRAAVQSFNFCSPKPSHGDSKALSSLQSTALSGSEAEHNFVLAMSLCHTARVAGSGFSAESPDEVALVKGAKTLGYQFLGDQDSKRSIKLLGDGIQTEKVLEFEILHVLHFNSDIKRMSIIVRHADGRIQLICKGADCAVLGLLKGHGPHYISTINHISKFSNQGLRTLVYATREVEPAVYEAWAAKYVEASLSIQERDEKMEFARKEIERDMEMVGATAVEDKLQDLVPETICRLTIAGIKLWVLTGDKLETAVEIGRSCRLIVPGMKHFTFRTDEESVFQDDLNSALKEKQTKTKQFALIIDGQSLNLALSPKFKKQFLELALVCEAVIVARSSALQKALVVEMVSEGVSCVTMAVGDGANDVAMIKAANVGVGIAGQEGRQAVRSSDYAVQQFSHLDRLLLHHGRLSYLRVSGCINYYFYKNFAFTLQMFHYGFLSAFSGASYFYDLYIAGYNVCVTALPVMIRGIMEQNLPEEYAFNYPETYVVGQTNSLFSEMTVLKSSLLGIFHSIVTFALPTIIFRGSREFLEVGIASYILILLVVTLQIVVETRLFNSYVYAGVIGSILLFLMFAGGYDGMESPVKGDFVSVISSEDFWYGLLLSAAVCLLPSIMYQGYVENLASSVHLVDQIRRQKNPTRPELGQNAA